MLPRVATTTGTVQTTPALQAGVPADAALTPQPSAATLANLRAEVLLRLIETMLKHMPRTAEPSPNRDLLETLLTALKTLPGRDGESGRKLADIIARLPSELRPSVEKLIGTVLSAMPTRSLVEIVRNPNGPEAQKLANLLVTNLVARETPAAGQECQQKPLGLTTQQLAAVGRHGMPQQAGQVLGDARALQSTLKRIFDLDTGKPRPLPGQTNDAEAVLSVPSGTNRAIAEAKDATRTETRLPSPATRTGDGQPVEAGAAAARHNGSAEDVQAAASAAKREEVSARAPAANATGQALARSVLQAVARDLPPALLTQAVVHLMENLSPEEANFLRALLERPFEPAVEQEHASTDADMPEDAAEAAAQPVKTKSETGQSASALPHTTADPDESPPMTQGREATQAAIVAASPDKLVPAAVLREGMPLAFVPYLPAQEDFERPEPHEAEAEETADEDTTEEQDEDGSPTDEGDEAGDEPETPDMARRREKAAEMVGVIEPGLVFYQKLGDYWT